MVTLLPDVVFDHGAAARSAATLRSLADRLDLIGEDRDRLVAPTLDQWRGRARATFDDEFATTLIGTGHVVAALRAAADRVDWASDSAGETQRHVNRVNAERLAAERRRGGAEAAAAAAREIAAV